MNQGLLMMPLLAYGQCGNEEADLLLQEWQHFLGPCKRPFGRQSFVLTLSGEPVAVTVSASTVNPHCGGMERKEVVELARLCAHPAHRDLSRVAIRLWRKTAAEQWPYWLVKAYVSYSNAIKHTGNLYRFDGWTKVDDVEGGTAGGNRSGNKQYDPKAVWVYRLEETNALLPGNL